MAHPMKHAEKKHNTWYAALTIPEDAREALGKRRFYQSTQTGDAAKAAPRIAMLVAKWQGEIAKARAQQPDPKDTFWESLRRDYLAAKDDAAAMVIQDIAEAEAAKAADPDEARRLFTFTTDQQGTLMAPLVIEWKATLKLAQKTIDQQHRDVVRMAEHFVSVEALKPQAVKAWTDRLIESGTTAASLERIMNGCRSLWRYLLDSHTVPMDTADPFAGAFRIATKKAMRNTVDRQAFTPEEVAKVYQRASEDGDAPLASLVALGAYSGCRIEELCALTTKDCTDGAFTIRDAKTQAGIRQVPIHPAVSALVKALVKASTDGYLVPSTAAGKYGVRSDPLSKRFGRLKTSLGFGPGHVFHSIRKTVATLLEQAGVVEGVAADILGHDKATMSYGLYSAGSSMKQKAEGLSKVAYPGALAKPGMLGSGQ